MTADRFRHFIAIDWSGAAGQRHKGIALAQCSADGCAPELIHPDHVWSRSDVLDYLSRHLPPDSLVGMDLGIALPFSDCGAYFPGWDQSPPGAQELWALIDKTCSDDAHMGANSFVDHHDASRYFRRHGGREGDRFHTADAGHRRGRLRVTECRQAMLGCTPYSNFNLVGAAQVGKSSLTGMRVLHHLRGKLPVWPVDPLAASGSTIVEIYTTIAALAGGRKAGRSKMRNIGELNIALANLGSPAVQSGQALDDHRCDALLTSAWLRDASRQPELWRPGGLTDKIARTEGWTFGAV
jgi:hypothetical protein